MTLNADEATEVTQPGVAYVPPLTPVRGCPTGEAIHLRGAVIWVDGAKFTNAAVTFTHILLQVRTFGGLATEEAVTQNNYRASPVTTTRNGEYYNYYY